MHVHLIFLEDNLKVPCFDLINSVSEIVDKQIIGVLATQTTVRSSYYKKAINAKKENTIIFQQECPEFVSEIEKEKLNLDKLNSLSELYLRPLINKNIEELILGCSHYPLIFDFLRKKLDALLEGVFFTRDLVSEPGNILHPDEYAKRLLKLKKIGLKVTVYDEKKLKKLGCNALLGVGQGSIRGSYLVTIEWKGNKSKSKPLAFVGKGVCLDTGGNSLKPARFMEDMTYDMAGSAVVVGLMKNFALRKAKINAVGVVGIVENMVSGNAQRPGDIVKSYSGKP